MVNQIQTKLFVPNILDASATVANQRKQFEKMMASRSLAQFGSKTVIRFLRVQPVKCLASGVYGCEYSTQKSSVHISAVVNAAQAETKQALPKIAFGGSKGRIVAVSGAVVDVQFDHALPPVRNAIQVFLTTHTLVLEVSKHLGGNVVQCTSLNGTDGLEIGETTFDTGLDCQDFLLMGIYENVQRRRRDRYIYAGAGLIIYCGCWTYFLIQSLP